MKNVQAPLIKQNLDTNLLKLIAIICMVIDHIGKIFLPDNMILAIIGRIAFPLFSYCLVVGCLYTRNIYKYIIRLGIFALISQPIFNMTFHPTWQQFWGELFSLNIFFTLIAGVLAVSALMDIKKRWWILIIPIAMEFFLGLDYGFYGIGLMIIFYLFRNKSWLSCLVAVIWMCCNAFIGDFINVFNIISLDKQFFALLALPLIYIQTNIKPKINKYFFYAFYPVHLLILFFVRIVIKV